MIIERKERGVSVTERDIASGLGMLPGDGDGTCQIWKVRLHARCGVGQSRERGGRCRYRQRCVERMGHARWGME